MAPPKPQPNGQVRTFGREEIIVSKTDLQGRITYANEVFVRVSGYSEAQLMGSPHSMVRHPMMPRAVYSYLWERIEARHEVFAYVVNLASDGAAYWVLAHVTPTVRNGKVVGYHSNRRFPDPAGVQAAQVLYARLRAAEHRETTARAQVEAGRRELGAVLEESGCTYDQYVWRIVADASKAA